MTQPGLFVGLITLDLVYLVETLPQANQKLVALDYTVAAGGPATNAAITFGYLGNSALLLGCLGCHPLSRLVQADLEQWSVTIADLNPAQTEPPPTSSILVTQATGDRAVVSLNALKLQVSVDRIPANCIPACSGSEIAVVLIDGHQMAVGREIAQSAKAAGIPIVIDGGSWKAGFQEVLAFADYVICSANFHPPNCQTVAEVFAYLTGLGIAHIAITQGNQPIQYMSQGDRGEIVVPQITPVDTLGAGDVFHGAFCHFILKSGFTNALAEAAIVAAHSCQSFGTRSWMQAKLPTPNDS